jgi:carbon-monoxide dehydrogenase medium subunit
MTRASPKRVKTDTRHDAVGLARFRFVKPPPFGYCAPTSLAEAASLLAEHGDDAKVIAGGQSLIPLLSLRLARPTVLVDLNGVEELFAVDGTAVGAMTRHRTVERSTDLARRVPLLAAAVPHIGHQAIRSRGTIGGSISHADPAAELPAVALALDAVVTVTSAARGDRDVPAADFFQGYFTTAMEPDEILVRVRFPEAAPGTGVAVEEMARRHGDFAMVAAVASIAGDDVRLALINVADRPHRATEAEAALRSGASIDDVVDLATRDLEPVSDLHATSAYRKKVAGVMLRRAIERARKAA